MSEDKKKLNQKQQEAVSHADGPLLIVAGAGTGKTTVLVERLKALIDSKLAGPEEILVMTFTEKATGEMEERADKILPYGYVDLWINTFHGFCERILRQHALDIGLAPDFKLLSDTEQWMLVRKNLDAFELDYYRPLGNPTKFIHELIKHFSRLKDENIGAKEYLEYAESLQLNQGVSPGKTKLSNVDLRLPTGRQGKSKIENNDSDQLEISRIIELANAYHTYNQLLLQGGYLDFGDLINYAIKLFKERPNILEVYRARFKYIMVDEFQDTNWAQYELVKLLAAPKNNLVVVGDDDQSIYKFRGASISNIMQFKDDFPVAKEIVLTENYRSGQKILDAAYGFIKHNDPNRLEAKLNIEKKLISRANGEGQVEHLHFRTEDEESEAIARRIIELYEQDKDTAWSDFAILTRANDTAEKFTAILSRHGIPNQYMSLRGLYFKPIVLDIIAYLRLLDNFLDSSALYRVLNMETFKVGHQDIVYINQLARRKTWSMHEALKNIALAKEVSPEGVTHANRLMALLDKHSSLAKQSKASKILLHFINDSGLFKGLDHDRDRSIFAQVNQFYQRAKKFEESSPDAKLRDFMDLLSLEFEAGETGSLKLDFEDADVVRIMTVHGSKGLEFKYVFIPCLVDKKFPVVDRSEKLPVPSALVRERLPEGDIHIEEERRLFYVGLTRAKDILYLTSAEDYGGARDKKPSKFLQEMDLEEIKIQNPKSNIQNNLEKDLEFLTENKETCELKYHLPEKFSFSQIEAYAKCPLQYKFAHLLRIPVEQKVSFIFGQLMHGTLNEFLSPLVNPVISQQSLFTHPLEKGGQGGLSLITVERLLKIYAERWRDDGFPSQKIREEYKKKGAAVLRDFVAKLSADNLPKILFLEKQFNLKISDTVFKGAIDRIDDLGDGTVEIIDYKTGNPKEKLTYEDKKQLLLYKQAVAEVFQLKASKLSYYYLENNTKISFEAKEKDEEKLSAEIADTVGRIKSCDFAPTPGFICSYCDFNGICEFRK